MSRLIALFMLSTGRLRQPGAGPGGRWPQPDAHRGAGRQPVAAEPARLYAVKKGDTLYASRSTTASDYKDVVGLEQSGSNRIASSVGQQLRMVPPEARTPVAVTKAR